MKTETFEKIIKTYEVLSVYGKKDTATIKKVAKLSAIISSVESNNNVDSITKSTLAKFKPVFAELPKEVRGFAKRDFCRVIDIICSEKGETLYFLNNDGEVNVFRVFSAFKPAYNKELFVVLSNLVADSGKLLNEQQAEKECNEKFEAYLSAMNDELNDYSIPTLTKEKVA